MNSELETFTGKMPPIPESWSCLERWLKSVNPRQNVSSTINIPRIFDTNNLFYDIISRILFRESVPPKSVLGFRVLFARY